MTADPGTLTRAEKWFGLALGIGAGLLPLSLMYVLSRAMLVQITFISLGVVPLGSLGLGAWVGRCLATGGHFRGIGWRGTALVVLLGWPASTCLPPGIRVMHARRLAESLPIYPSAQVANRGFEPFDSENGPAFVSVEFRTTAASYDVVSFYRSEMAKRHWKETPVAPVSGRDWPNLYFGTGMLTVEVYVAGGLTGQSSRVKVVCEFAAPRY